MKRLTLFLALLMPAWAIAQTPYSPYKGRKFEQLGNDLATPNVYRTGSGAPGHAYWQQRANYKIAVTLNDDKQRIDGEETIHYFNQSPDPLTYLWLQLDQNVRNKNSDTYKIAPSKIRPKMSDASIRRIIGHDLDLGDQIVSVTDAEGNALPYTINKTMMRVDLASPLKPGEDLTFNVKWGYNVQDRITMGGRAGYEYFPDEDNYLYTICQWFPRMCVYDDVNGWQNKQFLGNGEFALTFGDYDVSITVPSDHIVSATGELQNPKEVLNDVQYQRWEEAEKSEKPIEIVTLNEVKKKAKKHAKDTKTWVFKAKNVRDFAFGSSRKFIWDAQGVNLDGHHVMAMSFYPKEAYGLYHKYSTAVIAHTLRTYSKYTIPYPYPVAQSVEAANGMEYPMICFNYGRTQKDGTYSERTKNGMISVIIHEVGHNYFPMIINSDERQWTWMDEGLNTFLEFLTEQEWDSNFPSTRGFPADIVPYMKGNPDGIVPIMTNSEQIKQFGNNAYGKAATALNILRETVMGRELFDFAFKTYAQRWAFKHPQPEDFFRTMEDASGVDLDWFWKGWFYSTDHVDISIDNVHWYKFNTKNPEIENPIRKEKHRKSRHNMTTERNKNVASEVDQRPDLRDFYNSYDAYKTTPEQKEAYQTFMANLKPENKALLKENLNFYQIDFSNVGGLVMPIILKFEFADKTFQTIRIPAEIWKKNEEQVSKVFTFKKEVTNITLDPMLETADTDIKNNYFPRQAVPSRFEIYQNSRGARGASTGQNPMQKAKKHK
ncbi:M1 family metallopeptidase [Persicobacter psychrovividus]